LSAEVGDAPHPGIDFVAPTKNLQQSGDTAIDAPIYVADDIIPAVDDETEDDYAEQEDALDEDYELDAIKPKLELEDKEGDAATEEEVGQLHHETEGPSRWTKNDFQDTEQLGKMLGGFLMAEPYSWATVVGRVDYQKAVTRPLRGQRSFGAISRLRNIMAEVMVKHRSVPVLGFLTPGWATSRTKHPYHLARLLSTSYNFIRCNDCRIMLWSR
jgi:hypothetical protein